MSPAQQIRQMIYDLADVYAKELTPRTVELYVYALSDISVDRLERAIAVWVSTSHFFPLPDEIRETNAKIPLTPEEQDRARKRLLERIDHNPKQLASATNELGLKPVLETYPNLPEAVVRRMVEDALDPKPSLPLGAGMTEEQWQEHLKQMKERFLTKMVTKTEAPFPNLPELRLPKSNIADLNFTSGETEGLVMG
jgi:hypothetical protein